MSDDLVKRLRQSWDVNRSIMSQTGQWMTERKKAADHIEALEARVAAADKLAAWVDGMIEDGCPKCGGDCSSANPPVAYCPIREMVQDLAAYQDTKEGE